MMTNTFFFNSDSTENGCDSTDTESFSDDFETSISTESKSVRAEGIPYNDDALTLVFEWRRKAYAFKHLVEILLGEHSQERLCVSQPLNVAHNVSFLVDNSKLKNIEDLKCDDMGAWEHTGSPKKSFCVKRDKHGRIKDVTVLEGNESPNEESGTLTLKRVYYVNKSSSDVRKIISTVQGNEFTFGK